MEETLRGLVAVAFALLLVVLRFDAPRFGVAEHLESGHPVGAVVRRRLAWFGVALVLTVAILLVHPAHGASLGLVPGSLGGLLAWGLLVGLAGVAQAAAVGRLRRGSVAPVAGDDLGWRLANAIGTAVVDEVTFRGVLLGVLLLGGLPVPLVLLVVTLTYALATRTTPGGERDPYPFFLGLGIGLATAGATIASGGIGAALLGHAVTRIATTLLVPSGEPDDALRIA